MRASRGRRPRMSAIPTVAPDAPATVTRPKSRRRAGRPLGSAEGHRLLDALHAGVPVYFLMPLSGWSSPRRSRPTTSSTRSGSGSAALRPDRQHQATRSPRTTASTGRGCATPALLHRERDRRGLAGRHRPATASRSSTFRGKEALFWLVLGSVWSRTTALAIPTYLLFSKLGLTNNPLGDHPPVARQPVRHLPDADLRGGGRARGN